MLTFTDQQNLFQGITGDVTPAGLLIAKRDINEGGAVFLNRLGRKFNKEYLTANLKKDQQYYQFASEVLRLSEVRFLNGKNYVDAQLITDEHEWNMINSMPVSGTIPMFYYIRGFNELGIYPAPSADVVNGMSISYEPQHVELTQSDFTTGTVTVNNGSQTISLDSNNFTQSMVGRWFQVNDGSDGKWYRIGAFIGANTLNLENYYEGMSGSGRTFRIGEVMKIPQGYQDAPVYYAAERFYMTQNDQRTAPIFAARFEAKLRSAKETYARSTSRMGVKSRRNGRRPSWIDLTKPVIYP